MEKNLKEKKSIPLFLSPVKAGFPSPANDDIDKSLDLNEFLVPHPAATFFVKVQGDSMKDAGIHTGDILIIDKSLDANNGCIVLAVLDGEFTVKKLKLFENKVYLEPQNIEYKPIEIKDGMDFKIWGVVSAVIKKLVK